MNKSTKVHQNLGKFSLIITAERLVPISTRFVVSKCFFYPYTGTPANIGHETLAIVEYFSIPAHTRDSGYMCHFWIKLANIICSIP